MAKLHTIYRNTCMFINTHAYTQSQYILEYHRTKSCTLVLLGTAGWMVSFWVISGPRDNAFPDYSVIITKRKLRETIRVGRRGRRWGRQWAGKQEVGCGHETCLHFQWKLHNNELQIERKPWLYFSPDNVQENKAMQTMQELRCQTATSLDSGKRVFSDKKKKNATLLLLWVGKGKKKEYT